MKTAHRLVLGLVVWTVAVAAQAEPSAEELAAHCREAFAQSLPSPGEDLRESLESLEPLVILQPAQIVAENETLCWRCLPKRKLLPEEEDRVWDGLESILRVLLTRAPLGRDAAERVVRASTLGFLTQPAWRELPAERIREAILRYVESVRDDPQRDPEFSAVVEALRFDPESLGVHGRRISWSVSPDPKLVDTARQLQRQMMELGNLRRTPPQVQAAQQTLQRAADQLKAAVERAEPIVRRSVVAALARMPVGEGGIPLVSEADAEAAAIELTAATWELENYRTVTVSAPMTIESLRATTSKGSPQRTLTRLRGVKLSAEPADPVPLWVSDPGIEPSETDPPQLVVDNGGFAGGNVTAVAFSPDGRWLAAGGDVVRIWSLDDGSLVHTLRGQRKLSGVGGCTDLLFSPDGRKLYVAVGGFSQSVRVYEMADLAQPIKVFGGHEGHVDRLALSPDGRWLLTVGVDSTLHVCDLSSDEVVARIELPQLVDHLSFPGSQPWALLIDVKGQYALLDLSRRMGEETSPDAGIAPATGEARLQEWLAHAARWSPGGGPHGFALAADLAGMRIVAGGLQRASGGVRYWSAVWTGGKPEPDQTHRHGYYVTACALSADGRWVASADAMGEVHVWNAVTGEPRYVLGAKSAAMYAVSFDPSASRLLVGRKPLKPDTGWYYNHYSLLDHALDLRERTFLAIEPCEPPRPRLEHLQRRLVLDRDRGGVATLTVTREGQVESRLPFAGSARHLPLAFSFLAGDALGEAGALAVAGEDGSLTVYEPSQFRSRQSLIGHSDRVWCIAQSADGRLLASGSGDGTVRIWKLAPPRAWGNLAAYADGDGRLFHVVPGTPTATQGLRPGDLIQTIDYRSLGDLAEELLRTGKWPFRPAEKAEVVLQRGGNVYTEEVSLSDMGDIAEPLVSLYVAPDGSDWVAWTPQGYYDASQNGDRLIGWHVNRGEARSADFYRAEQFRNRFYRPDVVGRLLETGDLNEALRLADAERPRPSGQLDVRRDAEGLLPPRVRILAPSRAARTGQPRLTVSARIESAGPLPLRDARVLVNGKAYLVKDVMRETAAATSIERVSDREWVVRQEVELVAGSNELAVIASTEAAVSAPETVRVTYRPEAAPGALPRLFVLAVGIADYADQRFQLQFADRDAREFAAAWQSQEGGLYREVHRRELLNAEATEANILDAMQWLVDSADADDVAILFLSGHGVCDDHQNYYLATHEVDPARLRSTALSWREVLGMIYDLRCRRLLMFVDTCHGGGVAGTAPVVVDEVRDLAKSDVGAVLFASCAPQSASLEHPDWQHGAFTKALLETLADADSDLADPPDGHLSLTDLAHHLDRRVRQLTEGRQIPVVGIPPTVTNYDVFRLP